MLLNSVEPWVGYVLAQRPYWQVVGTHVGPSWTKLEYTLNIEVIIYYDETFWQSNSVKV